MKHCIILALLLLTGSSLHAQTIGVEAGASTLFNASGGAVTLYGSSTNTTLGVGLAQGHLVAGASTEFLLHGFDVTAGDKSIFLSTQQVGLSASVRGINATRTRDRDSLSIFAGAVGDAYSTPYFSAETTNGYGVGVMYTRKFHSANLTTVEAWTHGKPTALEGADLHWRGLELKATAGLLERRQYFIAQGTYRLAHAALDAGRQTFIWESQRSTVTSASATAWYGAFDSHASLFLSSLARGQNAGVGLHVGPLTIREDGYFSRGSRTFSSAVTERFTRHWSLSQFYTRSNGQSAVNFGGQYTSNFVTASLGYQQQFIPFSRVPFQKVLSIGLSFQLPHGSNLNIATVASPTGGVRWTTYGGSYIQAPWMPSSQQKGASHVRISGYEIRGQVKDQFGIPVCGAAISVNGSVTYTDAHGLFIARVRKRSNVTVIVALEEFTAPGNWEVVAAPASAAPDAPVLITVKRR